MIGSSPVGPGLVHIDCESGCVLIVRASVPGTRGGQGRPESVETLARIINQNISLITHPG